MKLKTIINIVGACFLGGALIFGAYQCTKKETPAPKTEPSQQVPAEKLGEELVINKEENPEIVKDSDLHTDIKPKGSGKKYTVKTPNLDKKKYYPIELLISPEPLTGQNLQVFVDTWDNRYGYWDVKTIKLYEDLVQIAEDKGNPNSGLEGLLKYIEHKEPGTHSYVGEVIYENGESRWSETKQIEFTGEILDFPPRIRKGIEVIDGDLVLEARDYGDNRGIVKVEVYEDGKIWKNFKGKPDKWFYKHIPLTELNRTGQHKYHAIFIDQGGNTTPTEEITIDYD